jgi:L-ascorbate metabolism protein UlaG (beta-lactamase superfamily)
MQVRTPESREPGAVKPLYYNPPMSRLAITWYGHSTFLIRTPGGLRLLFDPWFEGNPACPAALRKPPHADLILLSHGHADHVGDAVPAARDSGAVVVAGFELCEWLGRKGLQRLEPMNIGGSLDLRGLRVTMTDARHSSSLSEDARTLYLGEAAGFVVKLEDGRSIYFAGDTALFGDMRLIAEVHQPVIAFLPVGDRFTMGPEAAATACRWLGVRQVVPMHWGTFPVLTGTPDALEAALAPSGIQVLRLAPGETAE